MQVKKYFEKKVSLLSTSDVRYDGELYTVDPSEQSIALKHVNCMGTEGRRTGDQVIPPSDCTYEFIIFRAVNIRELWLDQGPGRRRDLTDEILLPLRSGQSVNANYPPPKQQRQDAPRYEQQEPPKRKVGYQSRSSSQQQFDPYYQQQAPPPRAPRGYDGYQGGGYGRGYGPPQEAAPPQYAAPPPQTYYDTPNQGYYYNNRQGAPYRQQRQYVNYRQPRPQYYNYNQGYAQNYGGYQQDRRRYNRGYNTQQRGYGQQRRGYNQGQRQGRGRRGDRNGNQAGTGAFLDNRRLRGIDIDIKDQQDFDFGAAKDQFDLEKADVNANGGLIVPPVSAQYSEDVEAENVADAKENADEEETKREDEEDVNKKYDKNKSFFDDLRTETKRSKPKQDLATQKEVDTTTFGSVAATYKSRHINRQNQGRYNQNRNYQQNRRYQQNYQRYGQQHYGQQNYGQQNRQRYSQQQPQYTTNKWVVRR
eukprot:84214_1